MLPESPPARLPDSPPADTSPSFSASPIRRSLPVGPFGISSSTTTLRGTLKPARRPAAKSRTSPGAASIPSRRTTAAATSSPSFGWGMAKVTTCCTAGCAMSTSSTSRGEIFSPPRLMISFRRPVMVK